MTKHQAQTALAAFLRDPAASYFGKYIARHSMERDPVDAAADLEYLAKVFSALAKPE